MAEFGPLYVPREEVRRLTVGGGGHLMVCPTAPIAATTAALAWVTVPDIRGTLSKSVYDDLNGAALTDGAFDTARGIGTFVQTEGARAIWETGMDPAAAVIRGAGEVRSAVGAATAGIFDFATQAGMTVGGATATDPTGGDAGAFYLGSLRTEYRLTVHPERTDDRAVQWSFSDEGPGNVVAFPFVKPGCRVGLTFRCRSVRQGSKFDGTLAGPIAADRLKLPFAVASVDMPWANTVPEKVGAGRLLAKVYGTFDSAPVPEAGSGTFWDPEVTAEVEFEVPPSRTVLISAGLREFTMGLMEAHAEVPLIDAQRTVGRIAGGLTWGGFGIENFRFA